MRGFDRGVGPLDAWFGRGLWFIGVLLAILLIAALVAGIVWMTMRRRPPTSPVRGTDDPLRLAAARYAAGEIDRTQFDQIRSDLSEVPTAGEGPPRSETSAG